MGNRWLVVWFKELREVMRDNRTMFNVFLAPLFITPILLLLISNVTKDQIKKARTEKVTVGIVGQETAPETMQALKLKAEGLIFQSVTRAEAEAAVQKRTFPAALILPPDADESLRVQRPVRVTILLDQGRQTSLETGGRLENLVEEAGKVVVAQRLRDNALSLELVRPFETTEEKIKGSGGIGAVLMFTLLPYMLSIYAIMGSVYMANDSVAGEKERGTLETLLISPASRLELVVGKFATIVSVSLLSSLLSLIGILWPIFVPIPAFQSVLKGVVLTPMAVISMVLMVVPLAVLGAGLLLAISTFARNQKEAQTYLGPVLMGVTVASMMTMFLKADNLMYAFIPVLNAGLVLKSALDGTLGGAFVAIACITSLLYAVGSVLFAVQLFNKESVLLKA